MHIQANSLLWFLREAHALHTGCCFPSRHNWRKKQFKRIKPKHITKAYWLLATVHRCELTLSAECWTNTEGALNHVIIWGSSTCFSRGCDLRAWGRIPPTSPRPLDLPPTADCPPAPGGCPLLCCSADGRCWRPLQRGCSAGGRLYSLVRDCSAGRRCLLQCCGAGCWPSGEKERSSYTGIIPNYLIIQVTKDENP